MAQRYGGQYSSGGTTNSPEERPRNQFRGKKPARAKARLNMLFAAPIPLAIVAFFRPPTEMAISLIAVALLLAAAWMTREGVAANEAYDSRTIARRPRLPRKLFASLLLGIGLAIAGLANSNGIVAISIFAVFGFALHLASFGLDPLEDKGAKGIDLFQQDRVAKVVEEGERNLRGMSDAIKRAQDRQLSARVDEFIAIARDMFRTVEEDPRDLTSARKFMGVYLKGAFDATTKFADIYSRNQSKKTRADFEGLLTYLGENFEAKTKKMLEDNSGDLDVEIEVLRERLAREGI